MRLAEIRSALGGAPGVVAVVADARGSSPRDMGAAMVIGPDHTRGTLGGGAVEHRVIASARGMLRGSERAQAELDFPLVPALDQCCGGAMRVALAIVEPGFAEPLSLWQDGPVLRDPVQSPHVYIYGAGHVGCAVIAALDPLEFPLTWVDAQTGRMQEAPPRVATIEAALPEAIAASAPPDAIHLVMTHSHAVDLEIIAAILAGPFGHCGLIGSATKRRRFERQLSARGIPPRAIGRLDCPIGLPGLRDKRPAAIAASVAAQLLMLAPAEAHVEAAE